MPDELDAWYKSRRILSEIALNVCGDPNADAMGIPKLLQENFKDKLPFKRAVSVGCSFAPKECNLVKQGIVESFEVTEINTELFELGKKYIRDQGLEDKVRIYQEDAFELFSAPDQFDFVYWDSSLHHMPCVRDALQWSRHVLKDGGVVFAYEFVGPTRNRHAGRRLELINYIRSVLTGQPSNVTTESLEINPETFADPTEMWDCGNIIPVFPEVFPNVKIKNIGGFLYQTVLFGLFNEEFENSPMMNILLLLDNAYAESGLSDYIVAYATKEKNQDVQKLDSDNKNLEELLRDKELILSQIYNSDGWKLLQKYYGLRDKILPSDSKRRRIVQNIFNVIKRYATIR